MEREVLVEHAETRRDLGEGDPERLHERSIAAAARPPVDGLPGMNPRRLNSVRR
jgi:hypothetical protein